MAASKTDPVKQVDVLIVYASGTPSKIRGIIFEKTKQGRPDEVDAVTLATPLVENCETIAQKLSAWLSENRLAVRAVRTRDIKSFNEILLARQVIIGTPARFWNVSWEVKKLFDEKFGAIYALDNKLAGKRVSAYAMAEITPSAEAALRAIKSVVSDCGGKYGPTMTLLTEYSKSEIERRMHSFLLEIQGF
jgi:hypothetical protein